MSNEALKPCPFPHESGTQFLQTSVRDKEIIFVRCFICGAFGPGAETEEEAIAAWNKRVKEGKS